MSKIVSPISMYRMLYMKMVEREFFFSLHSLDNTRLNNLTYKQFKQFVKNNDNTFYKWFRDNYLTPNQTEFKENKVTPLVIQGQIAKGELNWDGSDKDDAICFMIGLKNWEDDECRVRLQDDDSAAAFLLTLADKKDPDYKIFTKMLAKWKKVASESQKKFFKDQVQYLFENGDAFDRFKAGLEHGINTVAMTTQVAVDEAQQNPSSPLRPPEQPAEQSQQSQSTLIQVMYKHKTTIYK